MSRFTPGFGTVNPPIISVPEEIREELSKEDRSTEGKHPSEWHPPLQQPQKVIPVDVPADSFIPD